MSFTIDIGTRILLGATLALFGLGHPQPPSAASRSLEGTYWKAIELAGTPTPVQDANREAHLLFQPAGRVSGADGCNRFTGTFQRNGDALTFGQMAGTRIVCVGTGGIDRAFGNALKNAARLTVVGSRLELLDASGKRLAAFAAVARISVPTTSLAGTTWRLVRFRGSDGTTVAPDNPASYTIQLAAGGGLIARVDCNRGRGTWRSSGANHIQFGPLTLTRAKCPARSLHDQIVRQWGQIRSYVIRDGHLFLSLMADGGIYEFEPFTKKP